MDAKTLGQESSTVTDAALDYDSHRTRYKIRGGLTKREYFAGLCLASFCSDIEIMKKMTQVADSQGRKAQFEMATCAVEMADALLEELAKDQP